MCFYEGLLPHRIANEMIDPNDATDESEQTLVEQFCETWREWQSRVLQLMRRDFSHLIPSGEPPETLVKQTREAVKRMRAKETDEEPMFRSIHVMQADSTRGDTIRATWKAGDATIYMNIEIVRQVYLLFTP